VLVRARRIGIGGALGLGLAACAGTPGPVVHDEVPPVVEGSRAAAILSEPDDRRACGGCHPEITAEWSASQHRSAWSDPVFLAGYAVDRQPECRQCHAPLHEGDEDPPPSAIAATHGVACRSCHVRDGAIAGPPGPRTHEGPVEPTWGRGAACDGCHEFSFPPATEERPAVFDPREPMQRTMSEWAQSGTTQTCQDCHMPWSIDARGHRYRSHRMLGIDDPALMAKAVRVELRATAVAPEQTVVELEVHADAIGHAFPTGDMFRVAELRVHPEGAPALAQTVAMQREFGPVVRPDAQGRLRAVVVEVADARPRPGRPLRRRLRFEGRHATLVWTLTHLRMPRAQAERQGLPATAIERPVAAGRVDVAADAR
jgi:Cytochrome c554 and c-prime